MWPEFCILNFCQVKTTPISKIFGQKIHLDTNMIEKFPKLFTPNTNMRVIFGPKIRLRWLRYKKLAQKIRPNTNTIKRPIFGRPGEIFRKNLIFWPFLTIFWPKMVIFWPKMSIFLEKNFLKNFDQSDKTTIFYQYNINKNDMTLILTNTTSTILIWFQDHIGSDQYEKNLKKWTTIAMTIISP